VNISSRLLSERPIRVSLVLAALLLALGYLLLGGSAVSPVLGTIGALLLALLLKTSSELFSRIRGLERDSDRLTSLLVASSTEIKAVLAEVIESQERLNGLVNEIHPIVDEIQQQTASLEFAVSDILKERVRGQDHLNNLIEGLREDTGRVVAEFTARIDDIVTALQPVRRHVLKANVPHRELGLRDSLAGLVKKDPAEAPE